MTLYSITILTSSLQRNLKIVSRYHNVVNFPDFFKEGNDKSTSNKKRNKEGWEFNVNPVKP